MPSNPDGARLQADSARPGTLALDRRRTVPAGSGEVGGDARTLLRSVSISDAQRTGFISIEQRDGQHSAHRGRRTRRR